MVRTNGYSKSRRLRNNVEKYGKTRQATDDNIMRHGKSVISVPDK